MVPNPLYRIKVFPINALPGAQLVDAGIDRIVHDASIKFEATYRYYQLVNADLLFFFSDIAIQAEAMGAGVKYGHNAMPAVCATAKRILQYSPTQIGRMKVNGEVLERMAEVFPEKDLAALVYGPFTVGGQVIGEQQVLRDLIEKPREVDEILRKCLEAALDYARFLFDSGATVLWVSDPLAALIPPDLFREYSEKCLGKLFSTYAGWPSILHVCGDTDQILPEMINTGVKGISLDQCMSLLAMEDEFPENVSIIGNLDPVEVVEVGGPEDVASATRDLVAVMGTHPNFCLSTGCALPPTTPIENVVRFVDTGKTALAGLSSGRGLLRDLGTAVHRGNAEATIELTRETMKAAIPPLTTVASGLMRAVRKGSARYEAKQCFLPEILRMVDAFYAGFKVLEPSLGFECRKSPDIALGTVQGDVHEIGKDLVRIILEVHGLSVVDLGVDVSADQFLEAVEVYGVRILGISAFTTSSKRHLELIIRRFRQEGHRDISILVGGAAVSAQIAQTIGADGYAKDALGAVKLVQYHLNKVRNSMCRDDQIYSRA